MLDEVGHGRNAEGVRRKLIGQPAALSRRFIMRQMSMPVIALTVRPPVLPAAGQGPQGHASYYDPIGGFVFIADGSTDNSDGNRRRLPFHFRAMSGRSVASNLPVLPCRLFAWRRSEPGAHVTRLREVADFHGGAPYWRAIRRPNVFLRIF